MSWAPRAGEERQKDLIRTNARARKLRADQTPSEKRLWKLLRRENRDGANFRQQAAMGGFVFDFADFGARLLIELDGVVHELEHGAALNDVRKSKWAASQGFKLLRLRNGDVWGRPDWVLEQVRACRPPPPSPSPQVGRGLAPQSAAIAAAMLR